MKPTPPVLQLNNQPVPKRCQGLVHLRVIGELGLIHAVARLEACSNLLSVDAWIRHLTCGTHGQIISFKTLTTHEVLPGRNAAQERYWQLNRRTGNHPDWSMRVDTGWGKLQAAVSTVLLS